MPAAMSGSGSGSNNNGDASRDDRPQGSDKALLDRLNALKPTNISLGSSAVPAYVSFNQEVKKKLFKTIYL